MKLRGLFIICLTFLVPGLVSAQSIGPDWVSEPCVPSITQAVRDLPSYQPEQEELFGVEAKRRDDRGFVGPDIDGKPFISPLAIIQENALLRQSRAFGTPVVDVEGLDYNVYPPDPTGDVGLNYVLQGVNGSTSTVRILNKSGGTVTTFAMEDLATSSPCTNGYCDPIVLYDSLDDRWLISEFDSSANNLCVYISATSNPTGSWYYYTWNPAGGMQDYPKYGVWHDAYYVSANNGGYVFALEKPEMLNGNPATIQSFTLGELSGWGFQLSLPASADGTTPPPANEPGIFLRPCDSAIHTNCSSDVMQMWELDIDWVTPSNSSLTQISNVSMTSWDHTVCGTSAWNCMPQSGTSQLLDPIREPLHFPVQYRNWGSYETIVGSFVVDVDGTNQAAVRWFELRRDTGGWYAYQEGETPNDAYHRSVSCAAMDGYGNIAVGYTRTSSSSYASSYYAGRCATDPLGTLTFFEYECQDGSGYQSGTERWGDYAGMGLDPSDDATFWWFGMYEEGNNNSATRICSFIFDECGSCAAISASIDSATPNPACVSQNVAFTGSGTGEGFLSLSWDFEDDGFYDATGTSVNHSYPAANTYTVRLRVVDSCTDPGPQTDYDTITVTVNPVPGAPSITNITDDDVCVQSGIHVYYSAGSSASSHNLLRDGSTVVTGYTSGALYNPGDTNSHYYRVQAVNNCGSTNSSQQAFTDIDDDPSCVPYIEYDTSFDPNTTLVETCGNGDGYVEPGEEWTIRVQLENTGSDDATNVVADLAINTSSVNDAAISGNTGQYGSITMGNTALTQSPYYTICVDPAATCGQDITFDVINISSTEGSYSDATAAFTVTVGGTGGTDIIDSDNFTSGIGDWTVQQGNVVANAFEASNCPDGGGNNMRINGASGDSIVYQDFTVTGYSNLYMECDHRSDNRLDTGEYLRVDYSMDGGAWTSIFNGPDGGDDVWYCDISFNSFGTGDSLRIRFSNIGGDDTTEECRIDNFLLTGDLPNACEVSACCGCVNPSQPTIDLITDSDECAQSGVYITYTGGTPSTTHDLYVDGGLAVSDFVSGSLYNPGNTTSHNYVIRAINVDDTCYTDSSSQAFSDTNNTPGTPSITEIIDNDPCVQDGITITFTGGVGAASHDLWVDSSLTQSGISSPLSYNPGDALSHDYQIVAVLGLCSTASGIQPFIDADGPCGACVTVPNGTESGTSPLMVTKNVSDLLLTWDVSTANCLSTDYHIIWGWGNDIATYTLAGADCGPTDSGSYTWSGSPDTTSDFIWFILNGFDGDVTEGGWGTDSSGAQRRTGSPSGYCGTSDYDQTACIP